MKHGLTEGCVGCRSFEEGKRAQRHSKECRARLEAEIAKSDDGRVRLTTAYLRGPRGGKEDPLRAQGRQQRSQCHPFPSEAQDAPVDDVAGARAPMGVIDVKEAQCWRDAGHETEDADRGGLQPDPGSMTDDSVQDAMRDAGAVAADAVALAEAYSSAGFQQRAGAFD